MVNQGLIDESTLASIGESIREVEGSTELIPPLDMPERIKALGGSGVEYATGKLTFAQDKTAKTIQHGLSQKPKVFILRWDNCKTTPTLYLNVAMYTELLSCLWNGSAAKIAFHGMHTTVPGAYLPEYGAISADDENVVISAPNRDWAAGDWTWEAWTW